MSTSPQLGTTATVLNVPNQLTAARLVLSIVLFCLLEFHFYWAGLIVFVVAAGTDCLDGYWARKYGQVTVLGRILDPFVDKVIVCGTFIFLVSRPNSGVAAWMTTVIVGREMLVTALRSFLEEKGQDFSASMAGKWKMVLQCLAAVLCLYGLAIDVAASSTGGEGGYSSFLMARDVTVWAAVLLTIYSGIGYVLAALRLLRT
jgi:CDP-diacylglycerol--glycerol-3-phosphate 3-phosphatidyltransferase